MLDHRLQVEVTITGVAPTRPRRKREGSHVLLLEVPEAGGVSEHVTTGDMPEFGRLRFEPMCVVGFGVELSERRVEVQETRFA